MEEKEVKNEVPAPETDRKKEPEKQVKEKKRTDPAADTAAKEDAGLPAYGTGFLGVYVPDFRTVR